MRIEKNGITLTDEITVRLIDKMGGDHSVVAAAKVSTCGEDALEFARIEAGEGNKGLIRFLMEKRHGTPFEATVLQFFIHAPIFVWREFHRHRIASYNEESARYKRLEPVFWIPRKDRKLIPVPGFKPSAPEFEVGSADNLEFVVSNLFWSYALAYQTYLNILDTNCAKEVARACLPVGIYSSCWVTMNARSLMNFLSLRVHEPTATFPSFPQAEIEQVARAIETIFAAGWPITHAAFVKHGRVAP